MSRSRGGAPDVVVAAGLGWCASREGAYVCDAVQRMARRPRVAVFLPVHHEAAALDRLLRRIDARGLSVEYTPTPFGDEACSHALLGGGSRVVVFAGRGAWDAITHQAGGTVTPVDSDDAGVATQRWRRGAASAVFLPGDRDALPEAQRRIAEEFTARVRSLSSGMPLGAWLGDVVRHVSGVPGETCGAVGGPDAAVADGSRTTLRPLPRGARWCTPGQCARVAVVEAATGSGKSTLVPAAVAWWWRLHHRRPRIAVAMPRRLTVENVHAYVAGTPRARGGLGAAAVGMKTGAVTSPNAADAAVVFCTTGALVKELVSAGGAVAAGYTHVIVDEAHVRSAENALLLAMLRTAPPPNVVLMTATAPPWLAALGDTPSGATSPTAALPPCASASYVCVPSKRFAVQRYTLERTGLLELDVPPPPPGRREALAAALLRRVLTEEAWRPQDGGGTVLVFLPGMRAMKALAAAVGAEADEVVLLHSTLREGYSRVAQARGDGVVRLILATNTAELGVTLGRVDVLIDTGLEKRALDASGDLALCVAPKSALTQRAGRVGRVAPGVAYIMLTQSEVDAAPDAAPSELSSRAPEGFVLDALAFGAATGADLLPALLSGEVAEATTALRGCLVRLVGWGAVRAARVDDGLTHALTPLGEALQRLPLDPALGRFVVLGGRCGYLAVCAAAAAAVGCGVLRRDDQAAVAVFAHGSHSDVVAATNALLYYTHLRSALAPAALAALWGGGGAVPPAGVHLAISPEAAEEALLKLADVATILSDVPAAAGPAADGGVLPPPAPLAHEDMMALAFVWAAAFLDEAAACSLKAPTGGRAQPAVPSGMTKRYTVRLAAKPTHTRKDAIAAAVGCPVREVRGGHVEFERAGGGAGPVWGRPFCVWRAVRAGVGEGGRAGVKAVFKRAVAADDGPTRSHNAASGYGFAPVLLQQKDMDAPPHWDARPALLAICGPLTLFPTKYATSVLPPSVPGLFPLAALAVAEVADPRTGAAVAATDAVRDAATVAVRGTRVEIDSRKLIAAWGEAFSRRFDRLHRSLHSPDVAPAPLRGVLRTVLAAAGRPDGAPPGFDAPSSVWRADPLLTDLFSAVPAAAAAGGHLSSLSLEP